MDLTRFEGLTIEDLEAAIVAMKEAEEAKAREEELKAEAYLAELRVNMLDAAIQYLLALGAISEEDVKDMDVSQTLEDLKEIEGALIQYAKMFDMFAGKGPIKIKLTGSDADALTKFLTKMGL
jgi:hypothetical protein